MSNELASVRTCVQISRFVLWVCHPSPGERSGSSSLFPCLASYWSWLSHGNIWLLCPGCWLSLMLLAVGVLWHTEPFTHLHCHETFLLFPVFTKNLCSQMSAISGPLLQWLEDRLEQNKQRVQELQQEKEQLLEELAALEWRRQHRPFRRQTWKKKPLQDLLLAEGWPNVALQGGYRCASSLAPCSKEHFCRIRALSAPA